MKIETIFNVCSCQFAKFILTLVYIKDLEHLHELKNIQGVQDLTMLIEKGSNKYLDEELFCSTVFQDLWQMENFKIFKEQACHEIYQRTMKKISKYSFVHTIPP